MVDRRNAAVTLNPSLVYRNSPTVGGGHAIVDGMEVSVHEAPQVYEQSPPGLEPLTQAPGDTYQGYYMPGSHCGDYTGGAHPNSPCADGAEPYSADTYDKPDTSRADAQEVRRCKKKSWWVCIICALTLLALGVGIGVGISVGRSNAHQDSNSDAAQSSSASQTPSPTTSPTATYTTLQNPETTLSVWGTSVECPGANGTVFVDPDTKLRFLRLCAMDYGGGAGGVDIRQANASTMEECMTTCASMRSETPSCKTVTWLWGAQGFSNNYCWIKAGERKSPTGSDGAESAILLED